MSSDTGSVPDPKITYPRSC